MKDETRNHALECVSDDEAILIEDRLWWMQGRKRIIDQHIKGVPGLTGPCKIMDIGCGSGTNFDVLARYGVVYGVEPSPILANRARSRGIAEGVYQEDFFKHELITEIDLFTSFDVIEHIEDDYGFVANLSQTAKPNHFALFSVPACPFMYGEHDKILHHHRRYSKNRLISVFRDNGYDIIRCGYFMSLLFPAAVLSRLKDQMWLLSNKRKVNIAEVPGPINAVLTGVLSLEAFIGRFISFPIGLWLFILARHRLCKS